MGVIVVENKLNERQRLFCEYYVGECKYNAQRAAEMAGYSPNYARAKSYLLLQSENIRAYISELKQANKLKNNIDRGDADNDEIKLFWAAVMRDETARTSERLKASELLAKSNGAFNNDSW